MERYILLFLFLSFIYSLEPSKNGRLFKIPTSSDIYKVFQDECKYVVMPGDIFEYEPGNHTKYQFLGDVSGTPEEPIIIRGSPGAVLFGNKTYFENLHYTIIENLEISNASDAGLVLFGSDNVIVRGLTVHHSYANCMKIIGKNVLVKNNYVYECNQMNYEGKNTNWGQGIGTDTSDWVSAFSENITIEDNYVKNSWGEGIDLLYCNNCIARRNKVENAFTVLYYIDNSQNVIVEKNIGFESDGRFIKRESLGIQIATEIHGTHDIINATIRDNLIITTAFGFSYFAQRGHYENIRVVHNTFFNTSKQGFRILKSYESSLVKGNEVSNNIFSGLFSVFGDEEIEKPTWKVYSNVWLGGSPEEWDPALKDSEGYENTSFILRHVTAQEYLYDFNGICYDPLCYIPKIEDTTVYKKGIKSNYGSDTDYFGKIRDNKNPSIGFSEEKKQLNNSNYIRIKILGIIGILLVLI